MQNLKKAIALLLGVGIFMPIAKADDSILKWTNNSITLLHGTGFALPGNNISTITLEHASGWAWGDVFAFLDLQKLHDHPSRNDSWYGEFSPRFSLTKLAGLKPDEGSIIKEYFISTTWERGENGVEALLLGVAADLNVDGFRFFKLNLYAHKKGGFKVGADDMQLTWSWSRPFDVGSQKFSIDGFLDYELGLGSGVPTLHLVPQIKWDIGAASGMKPGKLYIGSEIDVWVNQFGIRDVPALNTNQVAVNFILKAHF